MSYERALARLAFHDLLAGALDDALGWRRVDELTSDELNVLQSLLWAIHQDVVVEWSRRQMQERSPA